MSEKRFWFVIDKGKLDYVQDNVTGENITVTELEDLLNEQQSIIDKQELRLQQLEELLELSENLNMKYREKLIDMNLKMVMTE